MIIQAIPLAIVIFALLTLRIVPRTARIVDGDTIRIKGNDWRLTGFDAPEWNQPGGRSATCRLRAILRTSRSIAFVRGADFYGRPLATILTTRGPLSWRMAASGHAHGKGIVAAALTRIAKIRRVGMWRQQGIIIPPMLWRQGWR